MENVITDVNAIQDGSAVDIKIANTLDKLAKNSDKIADKLTTDDPKLTKITNALEQIGKNSEKVLDLLHPGQMQITIEGEGEYSTISVLPTLAIFRNQQFAHIFVR